ncbi:PAS domain S-box protein [candidate division KSB1 bacterium]|nr:PAS domain S-box protein [candidate division KSB1 bacterium]
MNHPKYNDLLKRVAELERENDTFKKELDRLRMSERKYETLIDKIAVGVFRSTAEINGRFVDANPALVKMLGYEDRAELLDKNVADLFLNPGQRLIYSEKMKERGFVQNEELVLRRKDGTPVVVSETSIAIKDDKGQVLYFDGILEDITQRKKASEELQIQKAYFERLFNSAPEAIILHDQNDRIVDVNDEFTHMFGFTRKEVIGKPINDMVAPDELKEEADWVSQVVIRGERVELETKRKRKDGTLLEVSILGAPIIYNGKQLGDYAIYRDISARKRAEEELYIQKIYLEKLFNSAPEAIVWHDNQDIVVNVNDEFTKMFGYSRDEAIGKPINDLVAPRDYLDEASTLSYKVIHGERVEIDSKRKRKDGTLIDVWILGAPIIHDGRQMAVYAIYRDITERKKAEEARIRTQEEARMARNIQMNFLPKSNPKLANFSIAGRSIPAQNVGGDYYDFIHLDRDRIAIGLGDVSGKGLAASLVMSNLQATIRGQALFNMEASECLQRANKLLFDSTDSRTFISLFYGILNLKTYVLTYANAGQNTPYLFTENHQCHALNTHGQALGLQRDVAYLQDEIRLQKNDKLLIYSDGIIEAMNAELQEFGENRLIKFLNNRATSSAARLIDSVIKEVKVHFDGAPQNDDMTIVALIRK